jgi:hypothetical protein
VLMLISLDLVCILLFQSFQFPQNRGGFFLPEFWFLTLFQFPIIPLFCHRECGKVSFFTIALSF